MRTAVAAVALLVTTQCLAQDEAQIRRDCTADALRYCKVAILKGDRSVIINCMVENKDKLQPKCRRHLW